MMQPPSSASDESSRSSGYNNRASLILGPELENVQGSQKLCFTANGQGAPADSAGNYIYDQIYPEYRRVSPINMKDSDDSVVREILNIDY